MAFAIIAVVLAVHPVAAAPKMNPAIKKLARQIKQLSWDDRQSLEFELLPAGDWRKDPHHGERVERWMKEQQRKIEKDQREYPYGHGDIGGGG